jgi:hypothetical protein
MSAREEISSELLIISKTVAELPFKPVFTVPDGYFDGFPAKMMEIIRETEELDVVPELEKISPLLASISRKTPFSVPDGYFSNLEQELLPPKDQAPARVITMLQPATGRIWWAAAAVIAILGFFTWFYIINNNNDVENAGSALININAELPNISESEINSYLATTPEPIQIEPLSLAGVHEADFDAIMNDINESELQQFINDNPTLQIENMN